jgi:putative ABC transport system substrate-binding protein
MKRPWRASERALAIIGFVNVGSSGGYAGILSAFLKGLSESGFVEGRNVAIEYSWAEDQIDRLPGPVSDLIRRRVAVIVAPGRRVEDVVRKCIGDVGLLNILHILD